MVEIDVASVLSLLTVTVLAAGLTTLVPRVDAMTRSYRKFLALTTLGLSYLVLFPLLLSIVVEIPGEDPIGAVLAIAVGSFVLFGLSLLYDVFDDWIRLFGDAEYNTWVEASLALAVVVFLFVIFLLGP